MFLAPKLQNLSQYLSFGITPEATSGTTVSRNSISGSFSVPYGLSSDARGDVYVADLFNNRVLEFAGGAVPDTMTANSGGVYNVVVSVGSLSATTNAVTINAVTAGTISGLSSVNAGSNITLTDGTGAGVWSSGNTSVATVTGGVVNGVLAGTATISYDVTNSCGTAYATKVITVNGSSLSGITGALNVCNGNMIALTNSTPGGVWSMASSAASVVGSTGIVTASATVYGTATVTYTVGGVHTMTVIFFLCSFSV